MKPVTSRQPYDVTSWVAGLITEASPVNFPEGASVDEENFVLSRDGSRARRLGLDYETGYAFNNLQGSATASGKVISTYLWTNVNQNPADNVLVHQFGNRLSFYDADTSAISANILFGGDISITATTNVRFSFASIQGDLIVAVGDQVVRRIKRESSASYSIAQSRIQVRDFWGVDDGLDTDERTAVLSNLHAYNLYNQGWPNEFFCTPYVGAAGRDPNSMDEGANVDPVSQTFVSLGMYPSNADVIYVAMTTLLNGRQAYYPYALENIAFGNTPAAKGHYIIDLFDRSGGRSAAYTQDVAKGFTKRVNYTGSLVTDQSTGGIKAVAAYAGRIWYAVSAGEIGGDSRSPKVGTFVLFSQLVDNATDITSCYQEADPTAEDISDLVDTDGGYIQLPDAVDVQALVPFKTYLLVFAANGVWAVFGGDKGFTATEYQSAFLTNNGIISSGSIVVTPDGVVYWSRNGIYVVTTGEVQGLAIQSLTEKTIQTLYNNIPYNSKVNAVGYYDDVKYRARWLYQNTFDAGFPQKYTHELILDFSMPAWSKFTFKTLSARSPYVSGYIPLPVTNRTHADFKYATLGVDLSETYGFVASYYKNTDFVDWYTADVSATSTASRGTDAAAYLVTGYVTAGDTARFKSVPWLTAHFRRTETYYDPTGTETSASQAASDPTISAEYVALLLHWDTMDGDTSVSDYGTHHWPVITFRGDAQVDTAESKFGGASMYGDGDGDWIFVDTFAALQVLEASKNSFTDEFWVKSDSASQSARYMMCLSTPQNGTSAANIQRAIFINTNNRINCGVYISGTANAVGTGTSAITLADGNWHFIEFNGTFSGSVGIYRWFYDGILQGDATTITGTLNYADSLRYHILGYTDNAAFNTSAFKGWIDEYRVLKGKVHHKSNYTVPTSPFDNA